MGLINVFDIAGSGMSAQTVRLNTVASNMANANNVSANKGDVYRAKMPVFATVMQDVQSGTESAGVRVLRIEESKLEATRLYDPGNPLASKEGYVYQANVNAIEEMANMISASRSYQNNVEVMNTAKQLLQATLKLGQ